MFYVYQRQKNKRDVFTVLDFNSLDTALTTWKGLLTGGRSSKNLLKEMAKATETHKGDAIKLLLQGFSPYRVADRLPVSRSTVERWRKEFREKIEQGDEAGVAA